MPGATRCHPPALPTNRIGYLHAGSLSLVASPSLPLLLPDSRFSFRLPFSPSSTYRSHRTHAPSAFNLLFHRIGAVAAGGGGGPPLSRLPSRYLTSFSVSFRTSFLASFAATTRPRHSRTKSADASSGNNGETTRRRQGEARNKRSEA